MLFSRTKRYDSTDSFVIRSTLCRSILCIILDQNSGLETTGTANCNLKSSYVFQNCVFFGIKEYFNDFFFVVFFAFEVLIDGPHNVILQLFAHISHQSSRGLNSIIGFTFGLKFFQFFFRQFRQFFSRSIWVLALDISEDINDFFPVLFDLLNILITRVNKLLKQNYSLNIFK